MALQVAIVSEVLLEVCATQLHLELLACRYSSRSFIITRLPIMYAQRL